MNFNIYRLHTKSFIALFITTLAFTMSACTEKTEPVISNTQFSENHREIIAKNHLFEIKVSWVEGSLHREVRWRRIGVSEWTVTNVPLINRPRPWTNEFQGMLLTNYGPYQPAHFGVCNGKEIYVTMLHETMDFKSPDDVEKYLNFGWFSDHDISFVNESGLILAVKAPFFSQDHAYLTLQIHYLTMNEKPIPKNILKHHVRGNISQK